MTVKIEEIDTTDEIRDRLSLFHLAETVQEPGGTRVRDLGDLIMVIEGVEGVEDEEDGGTSTAADLDLPE